LGSWLGQHLGGGFKYTQEVQFDLARLAQAGRIGNPSKMDHPKDQPLCLVDWTFKEFTPLARPGFLAVLCSKTQTMKDN